MLRGRADAANTRSQLLRDIAAQNARYAGAGIVLDENGTPAAVAEASRQEAERQLTIGDTNATIRAETRRAEATAMRTRADSTQLGGYLSAGGSIFDYATRAVARLPGRTATPLLTG